MVLRALEVFVTSSYFPSSYVAHILIAILVILVLRAFSQGRVTSRERDLHARTVLITGGLTPLGLTILQALAQRGAHIIALCQDPAESPTVSILIDLLRSTTSNEQIYAEQCDLGSPESIRSFCTTFLTGKDQRLDAIIFAHEYQHIGALGFLSRRTPSVDEKQREAGSLATFLITTLLLPALLVAPVERDIRIINVVNPFYAAAAGPAFHVPSFASACTQPKSSVFVDEGTRSLRTIILTRHLQRILDALPTAAQVPKTEEASSTVPVVSAKVQASNVVAVSVSPGISRVGTVAPLLNADWTVNGGASPLGVLIYLLLQPVLRVFTKNPTAALQSVLHALFLPTPFKSVSHASSSDKPRNGASPDTAPGHVPARPVEVLKPGALYAECAVTRVRVPPPTMEQQERLAREKAEGKETVKGKGKGNGKGKSKEKEEVLLEFEDDGEYGGEIAGRLVWEAYEDALKVWERENPGPTKEKEKEKTSAGRSEPSPSPPPQASTSSGTTS